MTVNTVVCGSLVFLSLVSSSVAVAAEPGVDESRHTAASPVGKTLCALESELGIHSFVWQGFPKDPSAFSFAALPLHDQDAILILVMSDTGDPKCPEVIASTTITYPLAKHAYETVGFDCAVLDEKFDRSRAYIAIFERNDLEYTRAKLAWTFDFGTKQFATYKRTKNVYCPNFIAD